MTLRLLHVCDGCGFEREAAVDGAGIPQVDLGRDGWAVVKQRGDERDLSLCPRCVAMLKEGTLFEKVMR